MMLGGDQSTPYTSAVPHIVRHFVKLQGHTQDKLYINLFLFKILL